MRRILYIAVMIAAAVSAVATRAEQYPEESYTLKGRRLVSWNGPERVVDMASDPVLARVNAIADFAFAGTDIEEVTLPRRLRVLPIGCFEGCMRLEKVNMGERLGFIREGAFARCRSLRSLTVPHELLYIGPAAFEESGLESIDLSETSLFEYGDRAFAGCMKLTTVLLGETQPLALGYDIFRDCTALTSATVPDAWQDVPRGMFAGCTSLRTAFVGGGVLHIADSAFTDCTQLNELSLGISVESIGEDAFAGDAALRLLYLPESLRTIGDGAFYDCTSLERIFFGRGVRDIGDAAFAGCYALHQIDLPAEAPPVNWPGSFSGVDRGAVVLAVPSEAESAYYSSPAWNSFNVQSIASVPDTPFYAANAQAALYSLDGRRVELPHSFTDADSGTLSAYAPPGFYILCRPGMAPTKVIIR